MQLLPRTIATSTLVLIVTASAFAEDEWVGQDVIPKIEAEFMNGGKRVSRNLITMPARVQKTNGDQLWIGNAWVSKNMVLKLDDALEYYSKILRDHPTSYIYAIRANIWLSKHDYANTLTDATEAIRLDPTNDVAFNARGNANSRLKEYEDAISDFTESIRISPSFIDYGNRARTYVLMKQYNKAMADFDESIRIYPQYTYGLNGRAWLLATCPDAKVRDGKRAVSEAIAVCKLDEYTNGGNIDTLAAAYAEIGDFESAIIWEEEAIETESTESVRRELRANLALFRQNKPVRHPN
jgi:tetratricopeptide (TPR) repeat protein